MNSSVVSVDPDVLGGTPVFPGTRVPVQTLIEDLEGGENSDPFLEGFPSVTREQESFEVFVTTDQNLQYQQNLSNFDIAVIVLVAPSNRLADLLPLVSRLLKAIEEAKARQFVFLDS